MRMIPAFRASLVLATLIYMSAGIASAQITPSDDSYTLTSTPTTNYGAKTTLDVESAGATTFVRFDLSSIPSSVTGSMVAKATLKIYVSTVTTAGSFNVDLVTSPWTESTITADNTPTLGSAIATAIPITTTDKNHYVLFDVTAAVVDWLNGTANDGIALVPDGVVSFALNSKETTTTSHPAELDIVYESGGTLTGVTTASGSGLTGGGVSGTLSLSLTNGCAANQILQWSGSSWACANSKGAGTITGVTAGTDLTGGGTSGNVTLNLDATKVPQLNAANTFAGNQSVTGNVTASEAVNGGVLNATSSFNFGGVPFAFGSSTGGNAFLGFAGNFTTGNSLNTGVGYSALAALTTGLGNVAVGYLALGANGTGDYNTATGAATLVFNTTGTFDTAGGFNSLYSNTTGSLNTAYGTNTLIANTTGPGNTAVGYQALVTSTTGTNNTAIGYQAGTPGDFANTAGTNNTFVGYNANTGGVNEATLSNATAIGANAEVTESNALVLGSVLGVNGATTNTQVGIGTTAPTQSLEVDGNVLVRGPASFQHTGDSATLYLGDTNNFVEAIFGFGLNFGVFENPGALTIVNGGFVGIGTAVPDNLLTVNGTADKPGGGSWGTYSDARLKTLHGDFNSGLSQILKLHPIRYRYKEDNGMGIRDRDEHIGFVAQDVQRVIPEAVTENNKGYLLVNNDPILWTMLNAIKEQQREIATLRAQLRIRPSFATKPTTMQTASDKDKDKDKELRAVRADLTQLRNKDSRLEARLAQLERSVGTLHLPADTVALASSATTRSHRVESQQVQSHKEQMK